MFICRTFCLTTMSKDVHWDRPRFFWYTIGVPAGFPVHENMSFNRQQQNKEVLPTGRISVFHRAPFVMKTT